MRIILMNRCGPGRVSSASARLTRFATIASVRRTVSSREAEVLLHGAVLQVGRHPSFDVSVELAAIDAALLAFLPADNFPSRFERVRSDTAGVERHLGTMNGAVHDVEIGMGKAKTAGIYLV